MLVHAHLTMRIEGREDIILLMIAVVQTILGDPPTGRQHTGFS